ncbi:ParA family protein [Pendulispora rubella]|uniref:ParA family protein n=1 Tax=Pendulispora rubella TaxID=2741070 RepID=A0ABZ2LJM4_9BACT
MAAMTESCSICTKRFDVQFRYQMEEREGGFAFYCSQSCHDRGVRGEGSGGAVCKACSKRFSVELVSQVLRIRGERTYACSEPCRAQLLAEANGARLGAMAAAEAQAAQQVARAEKERADKDRVVAEVAASVSSGGEARKKLHGPRRLAIFNHKGGTGKTTTSVSVAAGLAERGLRVLLVDTDSQGNVGVSLGVKATTSLYHVLVMGLKAQDVAVNVRPNFDVLVSNETLAAAELYLAGRQNRDRVLRERLIAAEAGYDVVVLDCSPSLSLLNQNALVFADGILVPVACDFLSLVGVRQVLKTVKNVNSLLRHPVQIFGVLPTFYDARARICRDAVETLKEHFGERCLPPIRQTIKIKEAPAQGRTIYEYAPDSHASDDYKRVVDIIVDGADARRSSPASSGKSSVSDDTGELAATA